MTEAAAQRRQPREVRPAHPVAIIPAALVSLGAIMMFGVEIRIAGYLLLLAGVLGGVLTDRLGRSDRLGADLALIATGLGIISLISLRADISWVMIAVFLVVLSAAVLVPYSISRWVYREHAIRFPFVGGAWSRAQWTYVVIVVIAAYLILPFYFLSSGTFRNWPAVHEWHELARLFAGVNFVGIWDELFFICVVFTLLRRHFKVWIANLLMTAIFVSFLWELGYRSWGPLLTIPFAIVQGAIFQMTKNLWYVITVHLLFDLVVFLVIVHGHNPQWLQNFPLVG